MSAVTHLLGGGAFLFMATMKSDEIERKQFTTSIDAKDEGVVEAIVSVFNNIDAAKEIVRPGFFKASLEKKLPKGVWSHDWYQPVAKTLEARELEAGDPLLPPPIAHLGGLYVKGQFNLDTQIGRETFSNLKFGVVDEFSIGYRVTKSAFNEETEIRELLEGTLYEWSPVLVGANPATQVLDVKSALNSASVARRDQIRRVQINHLASRASRALKGGT